MEQEKASRSKREKTCCFTGHRNIPMTQRFRIEKQVEQVVENLIEEGVIYYGAGGALGFDTLAAQTIIRLKKKYPEIRLILVLPCRTQADYWEERDKATYEAIKRSADKITYTSIEYTRDCMLKRNRHLVDYSSVCICYQTEQTGGTAYTVNYAKEKELQVINIAGLLQDGCICGGEE